MNIVIPRLKGGDESAIDGAMRVLAFAVRAISSYVETRGS